MGSYFNIPRISDFFAIASIKGKGRRKRGKWKIEEKSAMESSETRRTIDQSQQPAADNARDGGLVVLQKNKGKKKIKPGAWFYCFGP